ncbi:MAG: DoxX family protein [Planctomycetota bacterium]
MTRLPVYAIVAVVLLRLLTGWHFFNEGIKKLDPDFTSAGFLRTAKGPFGPMFRSMVKGPYGAHVDLAKPVELGTRPEEERAAIDSWLVDYGRRSAAVAKDGGPYPTDIDPAVPGSNWVANIASSWDEGIGRLGRLGMSETAAEKISALRDEKLGDTVHYLHGVVPEIEDLQHLEWRLSKLRDEVSGSPAPFQADLIANKANEIWVTMQPWIASVRSIEEGFAEEAAVILADEGISAGRTESALAERSMLDWIDFAVKVVVLGSGICLFLGAATPIAAILAAGFLFSLILMYPPWVAGTEMKDFFTWSIECAALLVLAGVGAGRWAGIDGMFYVARRRIGDLSPAYQTPEQPAAPPTAA